MNGTKHDIPSTNLLREKGRRKEGFKRVHNQREKLNPKPTEYSRSTHVGKLASAPFLLAPRRSCPSSMCPCSMCVHAKAKTRNQQTSNGKGEMHR